MGGNAEISLLRLKAEAVKYLPGSLERDLHPIYSWNEEDYSIFRQRLGRAQTR